uniref:VOC domain-containing protein n=1 Tax=Panagrolaimus superbus TaxID=310955 RepID=A0A914XXS4_9BILA
MKFKIIRLSTKNIHLQRQFYVEKLGLQLLNENKQVFSVKAGKTILEIEEKSDNFIKNGYYHFCFNIFPSLLEDSAEKFLPSRGISLVTNGKDKYTVHKDWNAKSAYFYDADENILEFIARYNLKDEFSTNDTNFDIDKHLINISEIGIAVEDTSNFAETLQQNMEVKIWRDYGDAFKAIGDENGLILATKLDRPWIPTTDHPNAALPTEVTIEGKGTNFVFNNFYKFNFVN